MKVPQLQRQVSAPSSTQFTPVQVSTSNEAIQKIGNQVQDVLKERQIEQANIAILEGENNLKEFNRNYLLSSKRDRRGKDALGTPDGSKTSVYEDYNEQVKTQIENQIANVPKRFQNLAREKYLGVANSGANTMASYQAEQESLWREDTKKNAIQQIGSDLFVAVQSGNLEAIDEAMKQVDQTYAQYGTGANEQAAFISKSNMIAQSIRLAAQNNADIANLMMKEEKYKKYLSGDQVVALDSHIEQEQKTQDAAELVKLMSVTTDVTQQDQILQDSNASPEAKALAKTQMDFKRSLDKEVRNDQSQKFLNILRDEILVNGNIGKYTPLQVETDSAFDMLIPSHKKIVQSWLKGDDKAGQMDARSRLLAHDRVVMAIDAGKLSRSDLMEQIGTSVDIRDGASLLSYWDEHHVQGTSSRVYASRLINEGVTRNLPADKKAVIRTTSFDMIQQWITDHDGHKPNAEEVQKIVDFAYKGLIQDKKFLQSDTVPEKTRALYDQISATVPGVNKPQSELYDEAKVIPFKTLDALDYRINGYPNAAPITTIPNVYMVLGEPKTKDGYVYYISGDKTLRVPADGDTGKLLLKSIGLGGF